MSSTEGGGLAVQPGLLETEAGVLNAAAIAVEAALGQARGPLAEGCAALPGWQSAAALADCLAAWEQRLGVLVRALDGHADSLRATARNYREVDTGAASRLLAAAHR